MRVMPSVTETMVPTLRASVTDLKPSIRCLMRSEISLALMAMRMFPRKEALSGELVTDALEAGAQRPVHDPIPGAQHGPADERRIGGTLHADLASEPALERL